MSRSAVRRAIAALVLVPFTLAACGGDDDGDDAAGTTAAPATSDEPAETNAPGTTASTSEAPATTAESGAEEGAFPVTIEHKFGETTVDEEPLRVVSVGFTDQDFILALGVQPVAARWWYGSEEDVTGPWTDELVETEPEVLIMPELDVEQVAAADPDLIVGVYSGVTDVEYEQLSQIAPTIAQPAEYVEYGVPWQVVTRTIGAAVGRPAKAEELVTGLGSKVTDIREAHPEWEGKELAVLTMFEGIGFFASEDPRSRFFTELGFVVPEALDDIAGDAFYGNVSLEQADLVDLDVIVWDQLSFLDGGREALEAQPLIASMAAMQEGRAVFLEGDTELAFGWSTVLSRPVALDAIVEQLEDVVPAE